MKTKKLFSLLIAVSICLLCALPAFAADDEPASLGIGREGETNLETTLTPESGETGAESRPMESARETVRETVRETTRETVRETTEVNATETTTDDTANDMTIWWILIAIIIVAAIVVLICAFMPKTKR